MNKLLIFGLFVGGVMILYVIIFFVWGWYGINCYDGDKEIQKIVDTIMEQNDDDIEIAEAIASWEYDYIFNIYLSPNATFMKKTFIPKFPFLREIALDNRGNDPNWIMYCKYGACEEYASLLVEMLNIAGIESRIVKFPGYDHVIVEIKINNLWIPIDPTLGKESMILHDYGYYEEHWWGGNVSRVVYLNSMGVECDNTKNYSKTGNLSIKIMDNSNFSGSYNLKITSKHTKEGRFIINDTFDENLIFNYTLGDNNYNITVYSMDNINPYESFKLITLEVNRSKGIVFYR